MRVRPRLSPQYKQQPRQPPGGRRRQMADRYAVLKAAAMRALVESSDRGDVADPATGMPRAMASRCALCGKDMSVRDVEAGDQCGDHEMADEQLSSPAPHTVQRPGG